MVDDLSGARAKVSQVVFNSILRSEEGDIVLFGSEFDWATDDPRCCPSLEKQILYSYATSSLVKKYYFWIINLRSLPEGWQEARWPHRLAHATSK